MMKLKKTLLLLFCLSYSLNLFAQGEKLYNDKIIHEIRFTSLQSNTWQEVIKNYEKKEYVPVAIEIDGTKLAKVGLRIKGNRLNHFPNRPKFESLKVDINEYEKKQEYEGLKKLNIKNRNVVANHLLYKMARELDVPSCRTALAKVYFDNEYIGSYLLIEQIDKTYLKQQFKNKKGNLYKASGKGGTLDYMGEDAKRYNYAYEKKTNKKEQDYSDLIALLKFFSKSSTDQFEQGIHSKLNLQPFLRALAIEMLVNKRDAFYDAGRNYYLYNNPDTKQFNYIVDDFDYTFSDRGEYTSLNFDRVISDVQPYVGSDLIKQIFKSKTVKEEYYRAVERVLKAFKNLDKEIDRLETLTKGTGFLLYDHLDFQNNTKTMKAFIQKRTKEIGEQLAKESYTPASLERLDTQDIKVYPTNFKDRLLIELKGQLQSYALFNAQGVCVAKGKVQGSTQVNNLGHLPKGFYILELRSEGKRQSFPLLKQ